ncbi:MAG: hypothetical protein DRJ38_03455 [Thermoprotei archaeon]|nr:MAG: hypothetical protein DRJ38_03455 [Thermoprotei archaeon]
MPPGLKYWKSKFSHVPRHTTIRRNPESLFVEKGKRRGWLYYREEARRFLSWLRSRGSRGGGEYSNNTLHRYMCEFRKFCEAMHDIGKNPRELDYEIYLKLRSKETVKFPEVIKLYLKFLYETTEEEKYKKLYEKVRVPVKKSGLVEVLTREQIKRLINACGAVGGLELKTLVAIVYETGARVGEVLSLRRRDIVFDKYGARLFIKVSKSEKRVVRLFLYAKLLLIYLETLGEIGEDELIFRHNYNTLLRRLTEAWRLAELPKIRKKFHVLRHTRATEFLRRRVLTEKEMMIWFGWKTRKMIDVYAKYRMKKLRKHT